MYSKSYTHIEKYQRKIKALELRALNGSVPSWYAWEQIDLFEQCIAELRYPINKG